MASILLMSRTFVKAETTILPDGAPSILLESGLFAYSRNPIYVCMALILTGSGLLSGHIWSLLFVPLFIFAVYRLWILQEEQNLEAEFGQEYRDYKQRVRRWL
jgi:protein-S-isoprenylcysteine O-methyltransferase Ste14